MAFWIFMRERDSGRGKDGELIDTLQPVVDICVSERCSPAGFVERFNASQAARNDGNQARRLGAADSGDQELTGFLLLRLEVCQRPPSI